MLRPLEKTHSYKLQNPEAEAGLTFWRNTRMKAVPMGCLPSECLASLLFPRPPMTIMFQQKKLPEAWGVASLNL